MISSLYQFLQNLVPQKFKMQFTQVTAILALLFTAASAAAVPERKKPTPISFSASIILLINSTY